MKDLLDKISSYNLFNNLFPGILFVALGEQLTSYSLFHENIVIGVFVYYFIGLVISRIGSLLFEPLLKATNFIRFSPYGDYIRASKIDPKIELLLETCNMYRSLFSVFMALVILKIHESLAKAYPILTNYTFIILVSGLAILFVFAYRKQSDYIANRVKEIIHAETGTNFEKKE